jgi:hypothetical protein
VAAASAYGQDVSKPSPRARRRWSSWRSTLAGDVSAPIEQSVSALGGHIRPMGPLGRSGSRAAARTAWNGGPATAPLLPPRHPGRGSGALMDRPNPADAPGTILMPVRPPASQTHDLLHGKQFARTLGGIRAPCISAGSRQRGEHHDSRSCARLLWVWTPNGHSALSRVTRASGGDVLFRLDAGGNRRYLSFRLFVGKAALDADE